MPGKWKFLFQVILSFLCHGLSYELRNETTRIMNITCDNLGVEFLKDHGNGSVSCESCKVCPSGQGTFEECHGSTDTVCKPCELGETYSTYYTENNARVCAQCSMCDEHEIKLKSCDLVSDVICGKCEQGFHYDEISEDCVHKATSTELPAHRGVTSLFKGTTVAKTRQNSTIPLQKSENTNNDNPIYMYITIGVATLTVSTLICIIIYFKVKHRSKCRCTKKSFDRTDLETNELVSHEEIHDCDMETQLQSVKPDHQNHSDCDDLHSNIILHQATDNTDRNVHIVIG